MHCVVQGRNGAVSVIALAERGALFDPGPCMYMEKLAGVACPHLICQTPVYVPAAVPAVAWVLSAEVLDIALQLGKRSILTWCPCCTLWSVT